MNLSAYDKVNGIKTKSKIFIYSGFPYIVTREVKRRKYYCFVTRYEPKTKENVLFLVLLDDKPSDRPVSKTRQDNYGRLKFSMGILIDKYNITPKEDTYISLTNVTTADDGDIYKLEIV